MTFCPDFIECMSQGKVFVTLSIAHSILVAGHRAVGGFPDREQTFRRTSPSGFSYHVDFEESTLKIFTATGAEALAPIKPSQEVPSGLPAQTVTV